MGGWLILFSLALSHVAMQNSEHHLFDCFFRAQFLEQFFFPYHALIGKVTYHN